MKTSTILLAVVALIAARGGDEAPSPASLTLQSQQRGARVVYEGITAVGGLENLRKLSTVTQQFDFARGQLGQASRPDAEPGGLGPIRRWVRTTDLRSNTDILEVTPPGASEPATRLVFKAEGSFVHRMARSEFSLLAERSVNGFRRRLVFVPGILLDAWDNPTSLRYLGDDESGDKSYEVVTFVDRYGEQSALYFDQTTKLLVRAETVTNGQFGPVGDVSQTWEFGEYSATDGILLPRTITETTGPYLTAQATHVETSFNRGFDKSLLTIPAGLTESPGSAGPVLTAAEMVVNEVADGIYQVEEAAPGYHVTFVELDGYVVVIDALFSNEVSRATIEKIAEVVPGKPIKYVVASHHHFDHTAGLTAYMANGTTVVTTAGNEEYVRQVAAAPRVRYDGLSELEPDIEIAQSGQTFGTGANRFELHNAGPNPHANEILIAYFPEHEMIWVADIYEYFEGETPPRLLRPFADKLEELGLDYERFIAAHGSPKTAEQFREAVAAAREG